MSRIDLSWQLQAACTGMDTNLWFPEKGVAVSKIVRTTCANCPVREPCLEYAIENREMFGVWGGKTPGERGIIKRERTRRNLNGKSDAGVHSPTYVEPRHRFVAEVPVVREGETPLHGEHNNGSHIPVRTQGNEAVGTIRSRPYDANGHSTTSTGVPVDFTTGVLQQEGVE